MAELCSGWSCLRIEPLSSYKIIYSGNKYWAAAGKVPQLLKVCVIFVEDLQVEYLIKCSVINIA